ncbi:MAG: dihydrofolate reductase family protein, partial [Pseudomonadota bacterium]
CLSADAIKPSAPGAKAYDRSAPGAIVATTDLAPIAQLSRYEAHGADVLIASADRHGRTDLSDVLSALKARGVQSAMIEGGAEVLGAAFDAGLVDEVWAFIAPVVIGGAGAPAPIAGLGVSALAAAPRLRDVVVETLGDDLFVRGLIDREGAV